MGWNRNLREAIGGCIAPRTAVERIPNGPGALAVAAENPDPAPACSLEREKVPQKLAQEVQRRGLQRLACLGRGYRGESSLTYKGSSSVLLDGRSRCRKAGEQTRAQKQRRRGCASGTLLAAALCKEGRDHDNGGRAGGCGPEERP